MYCRDPPAAQEQIILFFFLGSFWGFNHFFVVIFVGGKSSSIVFVCTNIPRSQALRRRQGASGWHEMPMLLRHEMLLERTHLSTCWYKSGRHHHLNCHLSSVCELLSFSCRKMTLKCLQVVDQMSFRVKSPSCWNLPKCYQVRMTTIQTPWIVLLSPVSCGY